MLFNSFRARLSWFFVVIVLLPIVMLTAVLFRLVSDSERGKSEARLAQAQTSASNLYRETEQRSAEAVRGVAASEGLATALRTGDRATIERRLGAELGLADASRADLLLTDGTRYEAGAVSAVAGAGTRLSRADPAGTLSVSVSSPQDYADAVKALTGLEAVVTASGSPPASTLPGGANLPLPAAGTVERAGRSYRVASFTVPGFADSDRTRVRLLASDEQTRDATSSGRLKVAGLLLAFVLLAILFAAAVSRALHSQVQRLLTAARRLGEGDLDAEVPTEGNDEFADLGREFNTMARQLKGRLGELEAQRTRLQLAIRRVGESVATGLDRTALLEIVVHTAVDGVAAEAGRARVRDGVSGGLSQRAATGDSVALDSVLSAAEGAVLQTGQSADCSHDGAHALAHPLRASDGSVELAGIVAVARRGRPFSQADHQLFHYLAGQAAVSIENVDLHEAVQRQAVTDGLTGLSNHRRFQEALTLEVERAKRFKQPLGLVMLDLDDFKVVNDEHGHLQGDQVLREVARLVLETAREIDETARYGGEEMAILLPQTDLEGTFELAERLRVRIEALAVPVLEGTGAVRVTASVGAAALPESAAAEKDALVRAADSALYRAKRLGKNRVMKAG